MMEYKIDKCNSCNQVKPLKDGWCLTCNNTLKEATQDNAESIERRKADFMKDIFGTVRNL